MNLILKYFPDLSHQQQTQFEQLGPLYEEWNAKINVISRKDMEHFYVRHVLHSLAIAKVMHFKAGMHVLDIGTGGGFPVIPLAILFPDTHFTAVDSIAKKIKVVNQIKKELGLRNLEANQQRAEAVSKSFDFIISRAVADTSKLLEWTKGKFKKQSVTQLNNGYLLLKGGDLMDELKRAGVKAEIHSISEFFSDPFFETKKLLYIQGR